MTSSAVACLKNCHVNTNKHFACSEPFGVHQWEGSLISWSMSVWSKHTLFGMLWTLLSLKRKLLQALQNSFKTGQCACLWACVKTEQTGLFRKTSCFLALNPLHIRRRSIIKIKIIPILNKYSKAPRNKSRNLLLQPITVKDVSFLLSFYYQYAVQSFICKIQYVKDFEVQCYTLPETRYQGMLTDKSKWWSSFIPERASVQSYFRQ